MEAPFHIPDPIEISIDLPFPPSVNTIWRRGGNRRGNKGNVFRSPPYMTWIREADAALMASPKAWRQHTIIGPCSAYLAFSIEAGIGDLDNRIKALLDYAQRVELIDNDKLIVKIVAEWVKPAAAPAGCRLVLRELAG